MSLSEVGESEEDAMQECRPLTVASWLSIINYRLLTVICRLIRDVASDAQLRHNVFYEFYKIVLIVHSL